MARKSFAELKASIGKGSSSNNTTNYGDVYPFWNMKDDEEAIVRFLPDLNEDNPDGFLVEKLVHKLTINGQFRTVPCQKMYGDSNCPACSISAEYYNANDEVKGKKYYRDKVHLARAVIVSDPLATDESSEVGNIKTLNLSYQVYQSIINSFGDLDDYPFDYENGCNFIITKKMVQDGKNKHANYSFSKFARKETSISDYIKIDDIELVDLKTLLPAQVSIDEMETMLEADIQGGSLDNSAPEKVSDLSALKDKLGKVASEPTPEVKSEANISDEANSILADIMAKNTG